MLQRYYLTTFYHFFDNADPLLAKQQLSKLADQYQVEGIVILAREGINATLAAPEAGLLSNFLVELQSIFSITIGNFKDSESYKRPFRRMMIKIRPEIVTIGLPSMPDLKPTHHHLTPAQWDQVIENEKGNYVLIDTRNWYEYQVGSFVGALNPNIEKFTDFPKYFEQQKIDPDKKVLIFCTGGIRCEKGIYKLQEHGYHSVYQLEGGIINYLKERPHRNFEGECFVFDHRVAIDQNLEASTRYHLCPHCGQPGDQPINCQRCDTSQVICATCAAKSVESKTCSKDCAHHYWRNPNKKGKRQSLGHY